MVHRRRICKHNYNGKDATKVIQDFNRCNTSYFVIYLYAYFTHILIYVRYVDTTVNVIGVIVIIHSYKILLQYYKYGITYTATVM